MVFVIGCDIVLFFHPGGRQSYEVRGELALILIQSISSYPSVPALLFHLSFQTDKGSIAEKNMSKGIWYTPPRSLVCWNSRLLLFFKTLSGLYIAWGLRLVSTFTYSFLLNYRGPEPIADSKARLRTPPHVKFYKGSIPV